MCVRNQRDIRNVTSSTTWLVQTDPCYTCAVALVEAICYCCNCISLYPCSVRHASYYACSENSANDCHSLVYFLVLGPILSHTQETFLPLPMVYNGVYTIYAIYI